MQKKVNETVSILKLNIKMHNGNIFKRAAQHWWNNYRQTNGVKYKD